jgi:hypothetical protein
MSAVSKATAKSHMSTGDGRADSEAFRTRGLQEIADMLVGCDAQWMAHSLGDISTVTAAAGGAKEEHGDDAPELLQKEGNELFMAGAIARAIIKWRAAIWLMFHRFHPSEMYYVWDLLNSRHTLWERVRSLMPCHAMSF